MNSLCENSRRRGMDAPDKVEATAVTDAAALATLPGNARRPHMGVTMLQGADDPRRKRRRPRRHAALTTSSKRTPYRASGEQIWAQDQTEQEHMRVWAPTAQGVYRAVRHDPVQSLCRGQNNEGPHRRAALVYRLQLVRSDGQARRRSERRLAERIRRDLREFTVPKTALSRGTNSACCKSCVCAKERRRHANADAEAPSPTATGSAWKPMQVLVSDSRRPRFAHATVNGKVFAASQPAEVEGKPSFIRWAYTKRTARITAMFDPQPMSSDTRRRQASTSRAAILKQHLSAHDRAVGSVARRAGIAKSAIAHPRSGTDAYGDLTSKSPSLTIAARTSRTRRTRSMHLPTASSV